MSIVSSEIVWRKPLVVSGDGTNGGRMSSNLVVSGIKNNLFPDIPESERVAGSTSYRKVFIHVANDSDLTLIAPKVFVETRTPGDDSVVFIVGTQRDTQSALVGTEPKYGSGPLNATVSSGVTQITVMTESSSLNIFPIGRVIRISDRASVSASGNEEYRTVTDCTYVGNVATITFSGGLLSGYSSTNTKVASVYEPGDVKVTVANFTVTSSQGTYNSAGYPILGDSIASIEQDWTLTFQSPTTFIVVGDTVGQVGTTYSISSDQSPVNPDYSKPYFTIRAIGFGGTWVANNTITFRTSPASIPLWYRRDVPAGANSLSGNSVIVACDGESS